MPRELNILALVKGPERFVYVYDDESLARLIDTLRDQAADPECSLNWFDVSILSQKAREQAVVQPAPARRAVSRI